MASLPFTTQPGSRCAPRHPWLTPSYDIDKRLLVNPACIPVSVQNEWLDMLPHALTLLTLVYPSRSFFFSSHMYSVIGPDAHTKTSYLAPAAYSFWIWTLIDLLLLGMVVVQFTDAGFSPVVESEWLQMHSRPRSSSAYVDEDEAILTICRLFFLCQSHWMEICHHRSIERRLGLPLPPRSM